MLINSDSNLPTIGRHVDQLLENKHRFERAFDMLLNGSFTEAVAGFTRVLELQADHVQSHGNLGVTYAALGDRDNALKHLRKAIQLDPEYEPAINNLRFVLAMSAGERLVPDAMCRNDFYTERARARSAKA